MTAMVSNDGALNKPGGAVDSVTSPAFTAAERNERNYGDEHPSPGKRRSVLAKVQPLFFRLCLPKAGALSALIEVVWGLESEWGHVSTCWWGQVLGHHLGGHRGEAGAPGGGLEASGGEQNPTAQVQATLVVCSSCHGPHVATFHRLCPGTRASALGGGQQKPRPCL